MPVNLDQGDERILVAGGFTEPQVELIRQQATSQELADYIVNNIEACKKAKLTVFMILDVVNQGDYEVVKLVLENVDRIRSSLIESLEHVLCEAKNPEVVAEWIKNIEVFAKAKEFMDNPTKIAISAENALQVDTLAQYAQDSVNARELYKQQFKKLGKAPEPTTAEPAKVDSALVKGSNEIA